jgi:hypothetical protein
MSSILQPFALTWLDKKDLQDLERDILDYFKYDHVHYLLLTFENNNRIKYILKNIGDLN